MCLYYHRPRIAPSEELKVIGRWVRVTADGAEVEVDGKYQAQAIKAYGLEDAGAAATPAAKEDDMDAAGRRRAAATGGGEGYGEQGGELGGGGTRRAGGCSRTGQVQVQRSTLPQTVPTFSMARRRSSGRSRSPGKGT